MKAIYLDRGTRSIADLMEVQTGVFLITRINVPKASRGQGLGSKILKEILEDADEEDVTLEIHPMPSGSLTRKQLSEWYIRYGFKWGPSIALPGDPIEVLIREPRAG